MQSSPGKILYLFLIHFAGVLLFIFFIRTGHYVDFSFILLSLLFFLFAFLLSAIFPEGRYFVVAFAIFLLPRAISIILNRESHNLLFPFFMGISAGISARYLFTIVTGRGFFSGWVHRTRQEISEHIVLRVLVLAFLFLTLRSLIDYYSPFIFSGYPIQDLEVAVGVSSNYATNLTLLISLNFLGPLIFVITDLNIRNYLTGGRIKKPDALAIDLFRGYAAAAVCNLIIILLQEFGISRFYAGSALSSLHNRPPGLLTDSGASAVLLPVLLFSLYYSVENWRAGSRFRSTRFRKSMIRFIPILFFLLILLAIGMHQGRGYLLAAIGVIAVYSFFQFIQLKRNSKPVMLYLILFVIMGVGIVPLLYYGADSIKTLGEIKAALPHFWRSITNFDFVNAYSALDPARSQLFQAGIKIFGSEPWIGTGLNSFMVETAPMRKASALPADNPAMLFIGILSDTGIIGFTLFTMIAIYYIIQNLLLFLNRRTDAHYFHLLPLMTIPVLFIGYHIIFAEFAAFLILPFLVAGGTEKKKRIIKRILSPLQLIFSLPLLLYMAVYFTKLNVNIPPVYWRNNKGAAPQLHPDQKSKSTKYGKIFWFYDRRDLALEPRRPLNILLFIKEKYRQQENKIELQISCELNNSTIKTNKLVIPGKTREKESFLTTLLPECNEKANHIFIQLKGQAYEKKMMFGIRASQFNKNRIRPL